MLMLVYLKVKKQTNKQSDEIKGMATTTVFISIAAHASITTNPPTHHISKL